MPSDPELGWRSRGHAALAALDKGVWTEDERHGGGAWVTLIVVGGTRETGNSWKWEGTAVRDSGLSEG